MRLIPLSVVGCALLVSLPAQAQDGRVEAKASPEPTPQTPPRSLRLSPELFAFVDPLGKSAGAGGGLTLGLGSLELGARVLLGDSVGVGAEAGLLLGHGWLRPRIGLRGTAVPGLSAYGGGAVAGLRMSLLPRLTLLADVGAEYLSAPEGYRAFTLTGSVGVGFNLL
jgi:hypothetical protein